MRYCRRTRPEKEIVGGSRFTFIYVTFEGVGRLHNPVVVIASCSPSNHL
jgi:hypothetical protein